MAAREPQQHVVDFFPADRGETVEKESVHFQQALKPPLSLRTRESSALVCKHIFEKICSNAESNSKNNSDKSNSLSAIERPGSDFQAYKRDASNAVGVTIVEPALQGGRNIINPQNWQVNNFSEEHKTCIPEAESFSSNKGKPQTFPVHEIALTSPSLVPLPSQTIHHPVQQMVLPQVAARPSLGSTYVKQPTAQLTIFYSGTVNVYDDVPVDRANAIMLLAGSGNPLPLKKSSDGNKEISPPTLKCFPLPAAPPLHMGPASKVMGVPPIVIPASPSSGKPMGYSAPMAVTITTNTTTTTGISPSTPSLAAPLSLEPKPQAVLKRPHMGHELPLARKASLARFLERRKDRAQVNHVEENSQDEEQTERTNEDGTSSSRGLLDRAVLANNQTVMK